MTFLRSFDVAPVRLLGCIVLACVLSVAARADDGPPLACDPQKPDEVRLYVSVSGMHSTNGDVTITIYPDDEEHFLDGKYKLARQHLSIVLPVTEACFALPGPAYYAVALFHDENGNGHFDTTLLGVPAEGYGFSNDPVLMLGPPRLSEVRIPVHQGDNRVAVKMKYF